MIKRKTGRPSYSLMRNPNLVTRELGLAIKRRRERKDHLQRLVDEVTIEMKKPRTEKWDPKKNRNKGGHWRTKRSDTGKKRKHRKP